MTVTSKNDNKTYLNERGFLQKYFILCSQNCRKKLVSFRAKLFFFVRLMLQGCCVIILSENTRPDYAAVACAADLKELYFASDFPWVLCETAP